MSALQIQSSLRVDAKTGTRRASKPGSRPTGSPGGSRSYQKFQKDARWLPNTPRPDWLDGTLPGDRGFDPLGLAKPAEYLQYSADSQNINTSQNFPGRLEGQWRGDNKSDGGLTGTPLAPYADAFGLQRFRENELIHGRWAMLACLGVVIGEASTGVSWVDAGKVELDATRYLNFRLPFTVTQLVWVEAILVGTAEIYRNSELDPSKRIYPGGLFDPLNLVDGQDEARQFRLKEAELKHGRLAMIAFAGFAAQAGATGQGALGSLARSAQSFAPELAQDIENIL